MRQLAAVVAHTGELRAGGMLELPRRLDHVAESLAARRAEPGDRPAILQTTDDRVGWMASDDLRLRAPERPLGLCALLDHVPSGVIMITASSEDSTRAWMRACQGSPPWPACSQARATPQAPVHAEWIADRLLPSVAALGRRWPPVAALCRDAGSIDH